MESYFQINWWRGDGETPGNHSSSPAGRPEATLLSWGPALALLHAQRPQGSHLPCISLFSSLKVLLFSFLLVLVAEGSNLIFLPFLVSLYETTFLLD